MGLPFSLLQADVSAQDVPVSEGVHSELGRCGVARGLRDGDRSDEVNSLVLEVMHRAPDLSPVDLQARILHWSPLDGLCIKKPSSTVVCGPGWP